MTQSAPIASRPFAFDTEFDDAGTVVRASSFRPTKRAYMPAEVEALVAQARLEAREAALAETASIQAMAIAALGQAMTTAVPALNQVAQTHREHAAELALTAARVIAAAALDRLPLGPLQSALETLGQEIDASPRLVVRASGLDEATRAAIEAVATDAGFSGLVSFRDDPAMAVAAFALEWADGRADFDPAAAADRISTVLTSALASEAGHAESVSPGSDF
ncbi:flagellar assembly protein FlbE [Brevundimonas aurifodinae]|uniref:Flagellar assembly protein FlbE n=2 Tax=Brevundimonas TaxID=41275 RepID=A0ABV1NSF1_9CAUL|nr:MAG: flagellar assembly protein FlbE [Brevundimonas sp. 12-68-7]OYX35230.1 MAG: flagellar assembly protein FlbE [Brevundimonas subvibrioides]